MTLLSQAVRTLSAVLRAAAESLDSDHRPNSASTPPTPRTSTPAAPDEAFTLQMMATMSQTVTKMMEETRELVVTLAQGRSGMSTQTAQPLSLPSSLMFSEPNYDDDSIPLSPGIEAALWREEEEESELDRTLRQREDLRRQRDSLMEVLIQQDPQGPTA